MLLFLMVSTLGGESGSLKTLVSGAVGALVLLEHLD